MQHLLLKRSSWGLFAFLAIGVGIYPLVYLFSSGKVGILNAKSAELLGDQLWNLAFYTHITGGGISLLLGWSQFSPRLRKSRINLHRNFGKGYIISALLSGLAAIYIAFFAMGGIVAELGFLFLGLVWLGTTLGAYVKIRRKDLVGHQILMIYSYAACFAAVTLRLWLPLLQLMTNDFLSAYRLVAWLSWVPNMVAAVLISRNLVRRR